MEHAQTCRFGSKQHAYQPHNGPSIIFNNIFQLVAIKDQTGLRAADSLNLKEKVKMYSFTSMLCFPLSPYENHSHILSFRQLIL